MIRAAVGGAIRLMGIASTPTPADMILSINGECPGEIAASWEGATPGAWGTIVLGLFEGEVLIPGGWCGGTTLGVSEIRVVSPFRQVASDGRGEAVARIPAWACGAYLQMVVLDGSPCTTSNVVQIPE